MKIAHRPRVLVRLGREKVRRPRVLVISLLHRRRVVVKNEARALGQDQVGQVPVLVVPALDRPVKDDPEKDGRRVAMDLLDLREAPEIVRRVDRQGGRSVVHREWVLAWARPIGSDWNRTIRKCTR